MSSVIDSAYDSPQSCDPIIYGESILSDSDFGSLFAIDAAPADDLPFFKNGFGAASSLEPDNDNSFNGNDFTFDSMVDLDAGESYDSDENNNKKNNNNIKNGPFANSIDYNINYINDDRLAYDSNDYLSATAFETSDPPSLNAATASAQQPFLGAPA